MSAATEMPLYRSHKEVWALKIREAHPPDVEGRMEIIPAELAYGPFMTGPGFAGRFDPDQTGDRGYFVQYRDGYQSWSPTKAFEEGYTRIRPPEPREPSESRQVVYRIIRVVPAREMGEHGRLDKGDQFLDRNQATEVAAFMNSDPDRAGELHVVAPFWEEVKPVESMTGSVA